MYNVSESNDLWTLIFTAQIANHIVTTFQWIDAMQSAIYRHTHFHFENKTIKSNLSFSSGLWIFQFCVVANKWIKIRPNIVLVLLDLHSKSSFFFSFFSSKVHFSASSLFGFSQIFIALICSLSSLLSLSFRYIYYFRSTFLAHSV